MTEPQTPADAPSDGLWRWLVGGLAAGGIILGLLIGAYAIGFHHGRHPSRVADTPPAPQTTRGVTTTSSTPSPAAGSVPVTAALVARGERLYESDGCSACHSMTGSVGVGPSFKGLPGSSVALSNGQTIMADDTYLEQSITDPDAHIVKGYRAGVMPAAIAAYDLGMKPDDIRALVAFIKSAK